MADAKHEYVESIKDRKIVVQLDVDGKRTNATLAGVQQTMSVEKLAPIVDELFSLQKYEVVAKRDVLTRNIVG